MTTTVKTDDTYAVVFNVTDDDGAPVDLSSVNTLTMTARRSGDPNATPINLAATISSAVGGQISHTLTGTLAAGTYDVEIELVTFTNVRSTVPSDSYFTLIVLPNLD